MKNNYKISRVWCFWRGFRASAGPTLGALATLCAARPRSLKFDPPWTSMPSYESVICAVEFFLSCMSGRLVKASRAGISWIQTVSWMVEHLSCASRVPSVGQVSLAICMIKETLCFTCKRACGNARGSSFCAKGVATRGRPFFSRFLTARDV